MHIFRDSIAAELATWPSFIEAGLSADAIKPLLVRPPRKDMGDVALGCFIPAKERGVKPNELATKLALRAAFMPPTQGGASEASGASRGAALVESAAATGPYVNLKLNRARAIELTLHAVEAASQGDEPQQWLYGEGASGAGRTLVLDFSSPNIAKPLAVHHLRSTMIGYAIKKIRESQGWHVVGINHLGDWGTGFGKLIAGLKKYYPDIEKRALEGDKRPLGDMTVKQLNETYQRFNAEIKENEELAEAGRHEFASLEQAATQHQFDAPNALIWRHAREVSLAEFQRIYGQLSLRFDPVHLGRTDLGHLLEAGVAANRLPQLDAHYYRAHALYIGESFYVGENDLCGAIIDEARHKGAAEVSDGALVIWTDKARDKDGNYKSPPVMLLKSDGATSYHARDMASALYRVRTFGASDLCYVVGGEQALHFKQLFKALEMLGYEWARNCSHVDFGLLLFKQPDGTWAKASTRKGRVIMLEDLLDEAVDAVREIMREKNPEFVRDHADAAEDAAQRVGVGAVVFNDLKNDRRGTIKFDWDEILNFQGDTGPYLQMQYVRMGSVTEKFTRVAAERGWEACTGGDAALLTHEAEWEIALQLADFPAALERASEKYEPHHVARALLDLAAATSSWWKATEDTRIVGEDAALSRARVRLVQAIRKVLGRGLLLLGMRTVDRM